MPRQSKAARLEAGDGLTLDLGAGAWRVEWGSPDWLGPIAFAVHYRNEWYVREGPDPAAGARRTIVPVLRACKGEDDLGAHRGFEITWKSLPVAVRCQVRAYEDLPLIVFRLESRQPAVRLGTGRFDEPSVAWTFHPAARGDEGVPAGTRSYGHQYSEFALPVMGDAQCSGFLFAPHRPAVVEPLLFIAPDGRTLMLAPLDGFHEQVIAVPRDRDHVSAGVRFGWHGDLDQIPAGFASEMALWGGHSPRQVLDRWAGLLRERNGTQRPTRYADDGVGKLSYWTDNGAAYYYRTEPECDYLGTLDRVVAHLRAQSVPVRALQIDSWFYPHQHLRPVSPEGAPIVPPSGLIKWEPREDLFPEGFRELRSRTGGLPLTFHSRHFSAQSPYFDRHSAWKDSEYAHPSETGLYRLLMTQAANWGAITYEQDWMVESFLGVRGLREAPGRARAWQEALDAAAGENGLTLQWCMATPADFMQTVSLRHVTSIRTSGDYRYLFDNGLNWVWFLHTNALARALGLNPYKDVFLSYDKTAEGDGEPYAEIEALLSALSAGPVGIGDRIGCTNRPVVMRTCRQDGVLIKPDVPIAAIDRCFRANAFLERSALVGETYSEHIRQGDGSTWRASTPAMPSARSAFGSTSTISVASLRMVVSSSTTGGDEPGSTFRTTAPGRARSLTKIGTIVLSVRCCRATSQSLVTSISTPPSATIVFRALPVLTAPSTSWSWGRPRPWRSMVTRPGHLPASPLGNREKSVSCIRDRPPSKNGGPGTPRAVTGRWGCESVPLGTRG
jgi:hypothetical protein